MNRRSSILATLFATLAMATSLYGQGPAPNRSIVVLKQNAIPANVAALHGVVPDHVYEHALNGFAAVVPPGILRKLQNDANVAWLPTCQMLVQELPRANPGQCLLHWPVWGMFKTF